MRSCGRWVVVAVLAVACSKDAQPPLERDPISHDDPEKVSVPVFPVAHRLQNDATLPWNRELSKAPRLLLLRVSWRDDPSCSRKRGPTDGAYSCDVSQRTSSNMAVPCASMVRTAPAASTTS